MYRKFDFNDLLIISNTLSWDIDISAYDHQTQKVNKLPLQYYKCVNKKIYFINIISQQCLIFNDVFFFYLFSSHNRIYKYTIVNSYCKTSALPIDDDLSQVTKIFSLHMY